MNFPGLDPFWRATHHFLKKTGIIRPWNLQQCQESLAKKEGVLVVATTALGDSLLCTPLLENLAAALGKDRVGFLVREPYGELYQNDGRIGSVFTVEGKFRSFFSLRKKIKEQKIPFKIALIANCSEPDLIPWLWWCGLRGFFRYRSRWSDWPDWFANRSMMRKPTEEDYATGHAIENNLAMAEALKISNQPASLKMQIQEQTLTEKVRRILVHPGASREEKRWPLENWQKVMTTLAAEQKIIFILTGSGAETKLANELAEKLPFRIENLAGKLSLLELAQLQKNAQLFLSGDTGPYHLAVAVGCPTVTLFAPRDRGSSIEACGPKFVDPFYHRAFQTSNFGDSINKILPESVIAAAKEILDKTR